jgi:hypothetical protein
MSIYKRFQRKWYGLCINSFDKNMIMKRLALLLFVCAFSWASHAQSININGFETVLNPTGSNDVSEDLKKIQYKKYLNRDYKPAHVDDFKQKAFLRYNIYDDEMEFVKGDNIYYLKKEVGRKVKFDNNSHYEVFELNGDLNFFLVHQKGKNSLLAKQVVKFYEGREASSGYDKAKPADFKRKSDVLYILKEGNNLVRVPSKKKDFFNLFGSNANAVKSYMKKNKLNFKKSNDLKKVVAYVDTL